MFGIWLIFFFPLLVCQISPSYTATSRKVVGKSVRDNSERYCGWFLVHCSSKKFERMSREAMDLCWRVLKESNKSRLDSCRVSNSVFIISYACYLSGLSRAHFPTTLLEIAVCLELASASNQHQIDEGLSKKIQDEVFLCNFGFFTTPPNKATIYLH